MVLLTTQLVTPACGLSNRKSNMTGYVEGAPLTLHSTGHHRHTGKRGEDMATSSDNDEVVVVEYEESCIIPCEDAQGVTVNGVSAVTNDVRAVTNDVSAVTNDTPPPFEKANLQLLSDKKIAKEIMLGKRIGLYRLSRELGSGNFSRVKLGHHVLLKEEVAVKIIDKTSTTKHTTRLLSREIESLKRLGHPNIIGIYEVIETLAKVHIVMEYARGGELYTRLTNLGRISEPDCRSLFAQIVAAIRHMHSRNVIHRDIKAENVFFSSSRCIKIGDFGFSTFADKQQLLNTYCGSPPYAAPELFRDDTYNGEKVDIWASGVLLFFMVTSQMPFRGDTVSKLKNMILHGLYTFPDYVSNECQFLIRGILRDNSSDRFSIRDILESDWLAKGGPQDDSNRKSSLTHTNCSYTSVSDSDDSRSNGCNTSENKSHITKRLRELGITSKHLADARERELRSSVTGIYRIIKYQVQRQSSSETDSLVFQYSPSNDNESKKTFPVQKKSFTNKLTSRSSSKNAVVTRNIQKNEQRLQNNQKQSKTCSIL